MGRALAFCRLDCRHELGGDRIGDCVLKGEDVFKSPLEPLAPDRPPGDGIDELNSDAYAARRAPNSALEQIAHAEFSCDVRVEMHLAAIGQAGGAGDHE